MQQYAGIKSRFPLVDVRLWIRYGWFIVLSHIFRPRVAFPIWLRMREKLLPQVAIWVNTLNLTVYSATMAHGVCMEGFYATILGRGPCRNGPTCVSLNGFFSRGMLLECFLWFKRGNCGQVLTLHREFPVHTTSCVLFMQLKKVCYTTRCPSMWPVFWRLYFSISLGASSAPYLHDVSGTDRILFYALVPMQRISSSMAVNFHIYLSPTDAILDDCSAPISLTRTLIAQVWHRRNFFIHESCDTWNNRAVAQRRRIMHGTRWTA